MCGINGDDHRTILNSTTIVSGRRVHRGGAATGGLPGHLVRGAQAAPAADYSVPDIFAIDPTNPRSIKSLIKVVRDENRKCVIFPDR